MEITSSALRSSLVPFHEYLLQGSILDEHGELLLNRLNGLCDPLETGPEKFLDHELVYTLRGPTAVPQPVMFRVRQALDYPQAPWHVRCVGQPDVGDKSRHTLVRSMIDVGCSSNVLEFLYEMGFRLDHEFAIRGYMFRKGRMKITVSKIFRIVQPGNPEAREPVSKSYLVELSVVATQGQDQIQDDMRSFAEHLKPLVNLEKVDHRKLQQM